MLYLCLLKRNFSAYTRCSWSLLIAYKLFYSLFARLRLRLNRLISIIHRIAVCLLDLFFLNCCTLGALCSVRRVSIFVLLIRPRRDIYLVAKLHVRNGLRLDTPHHFIRVKHLIDQLVIRPLPIEVAIINI